MDPFYFSQFYFLTKAYKIKDTKLQHIFNVDYCTGIQCKMLIMMQIIKYTNSPIPESKFIKAMRHDMNKNNIIIHSILQAEQNELKNTLKFFVSFCYRYFLKHHKAPV